tara:strand:+ start:461 stop:631 length:171 start_codon:yes stop_codon:yes gene_type:complete
VEEVTDKLVIHHHVYNLMDYLQLELLILVVAAVVEHFPAHPLIQRQSLVMLVVQVL